MRTSDRKPTHTKTRVLAEALEDRRLLSGTLGVSTSLMVFNAANGQTSQVETLTITNTGSTPLTLAGATIAADPTTGTNNSAQFAVTNTSSLPTTLVAQGTFNLTVDYTANGVGLQYAVLDLASSDTAHPTTVVSLHGIGTAGVEGGNQPSLMRILRAYDMPNYNQVGETDETSAYYPEPPAANDSEVDLQQMVKAGPGNVTFNVLASFVGNASTPLHIGWYDVTNPSGSKTELFHTDQSDYQSVYVQPIGNTSFDPGSTVFGLYNPSQTVRSPNTNQLVTGYTQDYLNELPAQDYDATDPRKFRFFPLENADGSVVANSYIMTSTEWYNPQGYDFTNIVAIITNVKQAAPAAAADTATATAGQATTVDVLANDSATTGTLTPSSVTVTTAPTSGGTATVDATTGDVTYTPPATFHGTDTFAYTVANSAGYTSAPATVTVTVTRAGAIVTNPVTATATAGVATTIDVLSADSDTGGSLIPSTVAIATAPDHGGAATANADGTITYTAAAGYAGTETFTYTVQDSAGSTSPATTVTVTVASPAAAPVASDVTASTVANTATTINISATSTVGLALSTLAVTAPAHGTAAAHSDGTITYTPNAGFVGADSLTYTVQDTNSHASNAATVTVNVGVRIGTGSGDDRSLTFPQAGSSTPVTVTLSRGSAVVSLTGTGTLAVDKAGRATVTGSGLALGNLVLSNTTAASVLTIAGRGSSAVTIGTVSDTAPLGRLVATTGTLTGDATLNGLSSLQVAAFSGSTVSIGSSVPAGVSVTAGKVTDGSLTSAVPIKLLKAASWTNTGVGGISAPSVATLSVAGAFQADLALSGSGTPLGSATVGGQFGPAVWAAAGVRSLTVGSIDANAVLNVTGPIGTLTSRGTVAGTITAGSAKMFRVTGNVAGADLTFTDAGSSLGTLSVSGAVSGSTLTTAGSISSLTAATLTGDTMLVGTSAGATFADVTSATLGTATLGVLRLTARTGTAFSDTAILAHTFGTAVLGTVGTANGGAADGLAFATAKSVTGTADGTAVRVTAATKASQAFGDFQVKLVTG